MKAENPLQIIIEKLADESRRNRRSAILFAALGLTAQILIIVGIGLPKKDEIVAFAFLSLFFSWSLLIAAVFYLRKSRKLAARPANLLWRALTNEPQSIREIVLEIPRRETIEQRAAETVGRERQNIVGNILDGIFDANSTPDYAIDLTSGVQLKPSVFVNLTNGEKHRVYTPIEADETVAALKRHAPAAAIVQVAQ